MDFFSSLSELLPGSSSEIVLLEKIEEFPDTDKEEEKNVITTCTIDCGGTCPLNVHVKGGVITRITPYDDDEIPPLKACIRGLNYHNRVYSPNRLKYPLIRVGRRGEGKFRRISWDDAIGIVAEQIDRIIDSYGPEAIFECTYSGSFYVMLHSTLWGSTYKLLNHLGGRTAFGTLTSNTGASWASRYTYGIHSGEDANSLSDLVHSKLIVLWGFNPAENRFNTATLYWLKRARDKNIRFICVDPCHTDTVKILNAEWIPIRPSTDTAMLIAMAYVLITEELYDREFVEKHVFGFEKYRDYVLGGTDGVAKTPQWASGITGVPAETIARLSRELASSKPAAIIQGWAPGRTANGEQYHRAAIALQAMTGNIGIRGGSGSCTGVQCRGGPGKVSLKEILLSQRSTEGSRLSFGGKGVEIKAGKWADAVLKGKSGGYPSDIKMIWVVGHNILNQRQNVKKGIKAFQKVEFVVCQEQFLTPTALYSDVLLPANTNFERNDISFPFTKGYYAIFANKVIGSLWDSKSDYEIVRMLAERLGLADFDVKMEDEALRELFDSSMLKEHIDFEAFKKKGLLRLGEQPFIAFEEEIKNPVKNPFQTPSGKIEIYSLELDKTDFEVQEYSNVLPEYRKIPRIPTFIECEELPTAQNAKRFPLQLTTPHCKYRAHSQFWNIPQLRKRYKHEVWINPVDAKHRSIKDGDLVRMYNNRGAIIVYAKVTDRIFRGVVRCYEGAWYDPDNDGVDRGGCVNVLTDDMLTSPAGASNFNTCLVEIAKEKVDIL